MRKKFFGAVILAFVLLFTGISAMAGETDAEATDYKYTVTVYAGAHGKVNGQDSVSFTRAYGEEINLEDEIAVTLLSSDNGKYYFNGFRQSGKDNRDGIIEAFDVTKDLDLVVSYGIAGDLVEYTARYVEKGTGKELHKDVVFQGNVSDKPVAAYKYIEGYTPEFKNITKTLVKDSSQNIFLFEYVKNPEPETPEPTTEAPTQQTTTPRQTTTTPRQTTTTPRQTTTTPVQQQQQQQQQQPVQQTTAGDNDQDQTTAGEGVNPGQGGQEETGTAGENGGQEETTVQTQELGDLDVPLANVGEETTTVESDDPLVVSPTTGNPNEPTPMNPLWWIVIAAAAIIILILVLYFLKARKKNNEDL